MMNYTSFVSLGSTILSDTQSLVAHLRPGTSIVAFPFDCFAPVCRYNVPRRRRRESR